MYSSQLIPIPRGPLQIELCHLILWNIVQCQDHMCLSPMEISTTRGALRLCYHHIYKEQSSQTLPCHKRSSGLTIGPRNFVDGSIRRAGDGDFWKLNRLGNFYSVARKLRGGDFSASMRGGGQNFSAQTFKWKIEGHPEAYLTYCLFIISARTTRFLCDSTIKALVTYIGQVWRLKYH